MFLSHTFFSQFKHGIRPEWEAPACVKGGEWVFAVPAKNKKLVDDWWLYLVLACIGENFTEGNQYIFVTRF